MPIEIQFPSEGEVAAKAIDHLTRNGLTGRIEFRSTLLGRFSGAGLSLFVETETRGRADWVRATPEQALVLTVAGAMTAGSMPGLLLRRGPLGYGMIPQVDGERIGAFRDATASEAMDLALSWNVGLEALENKAARRMSSALNLVEERLASGSIAAELSDGDLFPFSKTPSARSLEVYLEKDGLIEADQCVYYAQKTPDLKAGFYVVSDNHEPLYLGNNMRVALKEASARLPEMNALPAVTDPVKEINEALDRMVEPRRPIPSPSDSPEI